MFCKVFLIKHQITVQTTSLLLNFQSSVNTTFFNITNGPVGNPSEIISANLLTFPNEEKIRNDH